MLTFDVCIYVIL